MADCLAPRVRNRTKKLTTLVYVFFNSFGVYTLLFKYKVKFGLTLLALCAQNIFGDLFLFDALPEKIETNPPGTVRDSSISTERWWSAAGNQCAAVMKLNPGYQLILEMFNRMFALSIGVCVCLSIDRVNQMIYMKYPL